MVVKLVGLYSSTCTRMVTVALREIGVPYELIPVDFFNDLKKEEFLATKQPFGQIPILIEDDGFQLFEGRAIARYLIAKYAPDSSLIPKEPRKLALFEQAMSIENNDFYFYVSGMSIEKYYKPLKGLQGSEERAAEYASILEEKLKGYERILSKQKYLAGDELTLADLIHLPYGDLVTELGFKGLTATPNVARWWADISSRETWKVVQAEMKVEMDAFYASQKLKQS
ncbi:glutathione S-transferase [Fomitiporia mediterranea MF3/22]|uniref:glutathione S-transferase n=1 Tax=Fomitiporia mediterranea (strain MF3/22) TaxID=694068 RepID=UPI000440836A|nr:glutathione S-transferase [Fomitiporia mediterranea MF3/22]EJD00514.1 glutathione S-transferase [Fomitiporia mediterranea MF3/22]